VPEMSSRQSDPLKGANCKLGKLGEKSIKHVSNAVPSPCWTPMKSTSPTVDVPTSFAALVPRLHLRHKSFSPSGAPKLQE
jgi:hypothetical protein